MSTYKVQGKKVTLDNNTFKAQGGEGAIHILGDTVYKICDPGKMIPQEKIKELFLLDHPKIVRPQHTILDSRSNVVGYTMSAVPGNAFPLAQILTKKYREREGVTFQMMIELVRQLADIYRFVHRHNGYLIVDGNEFNSMVTDDHRELYQIDVNSMQTPNFPADAIMASIRDWSITPASNGDWHWTQESDWWSFAILSFYMFTAIHPFKGRHPAFTNLKTFMIDQMKAGKSVLDPEVTFPTAAVYHPFEDVIPGGKDGAYMQWYRALFCEGKRFAAPLDFQAAITFVAKIKEIIGSNNFAMQLVRQYESMITGFVAMSGESVVTTTQQIYIGQDVTPLPKGKFRTGITSTGMPILAWIEGDNLRLMNLRSKNPIPIDYRVENITTCEGRIYVRSDKDVGEIIITELSSGHVFASAHVVASVMPHATDFYQGTIIQDVFGARFVSVFPDQKHHRQFKVDELNDYRIVAAKYEGGVLMVVGANREGQYDRLVFRFSKDWAKYELFRKVENIIPTGLNFTVTDRGVCICITEEEKVEIFSRQVGYAEVKSVSDPAIHGDMHLCHYGNNVKVAVGEKLYSFSMK